MKIVTAQLLVLVIALVTGFSEILVAADRLYQYNEDRYGSHVITSEEIRDLPMRGAGDSLHILQTLPGIGGAYSLAPVPIIRGMNPIYDRYYIDDIPVDFPYHSAFGIIPVLSTIPETLIERAEVIKGPHPLYYNDALGSIIDIKTKEPSMSGIQGSVLMDPIVPIFPTVSVIGQPFDAVSVVASGRRSLIDLMLDASGFDLSAYDIESTDRFSFQDYYAKVGFSILEKNKLFLIAFGTHDNFSTSELETESGHHVEALKWEFIPGDNISLKTIFSHYQFTLQLEDRKVESNEIPIKILYNPEQFRLFQMLNVRLDNYFIKTGYEVTIHKKGVTGNVTIDDIGAKNLDELSSTGEDMTNAVEGNSYAVFAEGGGNIKPFSFTTLWLTLGGRYSHSGPLSENSYDYRGNAGVTIFKHHSLYVGTGTHHASPDIYYYLVNSSRTYSVIRSQNTIAGYSLKLNKTFQGQFEAYYTRYNNLPNATNNTLVSGEVTTLIQINPYSNAREGTSRGGELFLRASHNNMYGWISYSYCESRMTNSDKALDNLYSNFDQTHILKIVYALKLGNWNPSAIWHYYTPLPYTPVTGSETPTTTASGATKHQALYGELNSGRFPANHRLDLKLTYLFGESSRVYVEFWNVYFQKNYLYPKYDNSKPYSAENPKDKSDTPPVFIWLGMELSF